MKGVELDRIMDKELMGRPFDQYRCFYIKDFLRGDSIRVKFSKDEKSIRGVVMDVDMNNFNVIYKTADDEENRTTIEYIVSLEEYKPDWLAKE
tara:strand:+ start:537 stop:815 length:279 start_codon:yes stop_codon:yes gene_type:complete